MFACWNREGRPTITLTKRADIDRCKGIEIDNVVLKTCKKNNFDPMKCNYWLTDNAAAYMSGLNAGAVARFNLQSQAQAYRMNTFSTHRNN